MSAGKGVNPWVVVAFAALMQAIIIGANIYSFGFFVVPWMTEFQLERGTLMLAITASSLVAAFISPFCGYLIDKVSSRKLVVGGSLVFAGGLLLISWLPAYPTVLSVYALAFPVGTTLAGTLMALSLVGKLFTRNRGLAMGLVVLGTNIGGLVMPLLVTHLLASYSWQQVFQVIAAMVVVVVSLPALFILAGIAAPPGSAHNSAEKGAALRVMRSAAVIKLGVAYLVPCLLFVGLLHNIGAMAADLSIDQQRAAWITAAASVVMGVGKVATGALSDRLNHRLLYTVCMVLIAAGLVTVSFSASFLSLLLGVGLTALVMGGIAPLVATIVADRWGGALFGRVMGVVQAFAGASALGALLAGYLRDVTGNYSQVYLLMLVSLVPALYCMFTLPREAQLALQPEISGVR
ncbi:MAG: MFS transporter [Gammaproteobacteria bacterium]|nr:MFS transporter [Gammaproteobacteria bacterium]